MPWGKIFSGGSDESSRPILLRFALDGWCRRVLALDPVPRPTGAVGRVEALRHDAFEPELAHTAFPSVSLIKVLYCFHQNKADSKCEVVHTSHPDSVPTIRPSEFGLLAGGDALRGEFINEYQKLNSEDQKTFRRWLWANTVVGVILLTGLIALAVHQGDESEATAENATMHTQAKLP